MSKTVLIASNNPVIADYLKESGVTVTEVASAAEVFAHVKASKPTAVILTEDLPDGSSAMSVYTALRHEYGLFNLDIILFSDNRHLHHHAATELIGKGETRLQMASSTSSLKDIARHYLPIIA